MAFFPSLPEDARHIHVWGFHLERYRVWPFLAHGIMRGDSPLTVAERETIGAYVSGVNACGYCYGAHEAVAAEYGVEPEVFTALFEDLDTAPVDDKLKPILHYIRKLTETPTKMTQADADAVFEAGWDEYALHDAIAVCCIFNWMNRFMLGHGIQPLPPEVARSSASTRAQLGYIGKAALERGLDMVEGLSPQLRDVVEREMERLGAPREGTFNDANARARGRRNAVGAKP